MALIVTMKETHQVKVGATLYTVEEVVSPTVFFVRNESTSGLHRVDVDDWVEVEEDVFFIAGTQDKDYGSWVKLLIKAPPQFIISEIRKGD